MILIEPTTEYEEQIRAYRDEFLECSSSMDGTGALRRIEEPSEWIEDCLMCKNPDTTPEGLVPATQFILVRESDEKNSRNDSGKTLFQ